jgi:hypothetical protein
MKEEEGEDDDGRRKLKKNNMKGERQKREDVKEKRDKQ